MEIKIILAGSNSDKCHLELNGELIAYDTRTSIFNRVMCLLNMSTCNVKIQVKE